MRFIGSIIEKLQRHPKRVVFPEGEEPRVLQAARQFLALQLGAPILLGDAERIKTIAADLQVSLEGIRIIDPARSEELENFVRRFISLRREKGVKGFVLGGWAINGIVQLSSGLPVTVAQSGDSHNTGPQSSPRPNVVAGQKVDRAWANRTIDQWFNTAAFIRSKCNGCAGEGTYAGGLGYGNAGVSLFDSPAMKTWDFALFKEWHFLERHKLQFRYEAFNFTNTPQFSAPSRSLGSADLGRIGGTVINNREMQFGLKYSF